MAALKISARRAVLITTIFGLPACGVQDNTRNEAFTLVNDQSALEARVEKSPRDMTIVPDATALGLTRLNLSYTLRLIGELRAPVVDGHTLQATDIYSDGGYAYVSYNTAGDEKRGGVEVLDVSDEDNPRVISQLLYKNADVSAIAYYDGHLYAVGADTNSQPAFLNKYELSDTDNGLTGSFETVRLSSHAGNDVAVMGGKVAATSGSSGHLGFYNTDNLAQISTIQQNYLRSVSFDRRTGTAWALQGEHGTSFHYSAAGDKQSEPISFGGANLDQAKSTINVGGNTILTALNEGGAKVICKQNGRVLATIPVNNPDGLAPTKAVTNAAAMENGFLFTANGEAGISLYVVRSSNRNSCGIRSIYKQGRVDFGSDFSANHVFYSRGYVFVADGGGGVKILKLKRESNCRSPENDNDQDADNSGNIQICFRGRTYSLPPRAAMAFLRNGAVRGACQ